MTYFDIIFDEGYIDLELSSCHVISLDLISHTKNHWEI